MYGICVRGIYQDEKKLIRAHFITQRKKGANLRSQSPMFNFRPVTHVACTEYGPHFTKLHNIFFFSVSITTSFMAFGLEVLFLKIKYNTL